MDIAAMFAAMDVTTIHQFIQRGQEENLSLDFKTVRSSDLGDKNDKRSLARALSGFANSSGGLVVWGVDARKNADDIDCTQSAEEIPNVKQFVTRLNALTGEAVTPLVDVVTQIVETHVGKSRALQDALVVSRGQIPKVERSPVQAPASSRVVNTPPGKWARVPVKTQTWDSGSKGR